ncbi:UNVERIFIED_CONTAM: Receptor-like protein EIX2 [Sesamum angustifolium]|uniref:Receptor-like protein EIX2 n=1 Tax=Sesamum angustifolium TaxID=2727405 RepID=A0AAW2NK87_9LAMI
MKFFQLQYPLSLVLLLLILRCENSYSSQLHNTNRIRCLERERQALLNIKSQLVDTHGRLSSWGTDEDKRDDCCEWRGIHCHNRSNNVIRLDLQFYNLGGKISTSLLELQHLRYLDVSGNDFEYAPIPEFIGSLTKLQYLSLVWANFVGPIPRQIGNLSKLHFLDISCNYNCYSENLDWVFSLGSLEHLRLTLINLSKATNWVMMNLSIGLLEKKLEYLDLGGNKFTGTFPNMSRFSSLHTLFLDRNNLSGSIREGYLRLPHLATLDLSSNKLIGPIPNLSFSSSLERLFLSNNMFNGTLTETMFNLRLPHLATLDLSSNKLIGPIPDLSFSSSLVSLYLSNNMFNGTLTESIGHLSQLLELDLSFNSFLEVQFSPSWVPRFKLKLLFLTQCKLGNYFPKWLETQKELSEIDISSTGISDIIPSWFGSIPNFSLPLDSEPKGIVILDISKNMISGSLNFLRNVKEWVLLDLSDNLFSGQIPDCFANFQNLAFLSLANNHLYGKIPHSFGQLNALTLLHLRNNSLSGGIPTTMRNFRGLKMIDLGGNKLTGNIPSWIGDSFPELIVLILRSNELYGDIPSNICRLPNLQILDISSNKNISGAIPECLQDYVAMSTEQFLDDDRLFFPNHTTRVSLRKDFHSFESAHFMWKGKELKYTSHLGLVKLIDFSDNIGPIPPHIGEMKSLNSLDFSRNHLLGGIPTSICDLDSLGRLHLSYNNLSGRIPQDNHCLTFERPTYIGNVGLCGPPLNKSCPGDEPIQDPNSTVDAQGEFHDDDDDRFITRGFYIALALGFIVGFWGIYGTILLNKTFKYAVFNKFNVIGDFVCLRIELSKARFWRFFQTR